MEELIQLAKRRGDWEVSANGQFTHGLARPFAAHQSRRTHDDPRERIAKVIEDGGKSPRNSANKANGAQAGDCDD